MGKKQHLVIVGGCGRVGLPLGLAFAETGSLKVTLLDLDQKRVEQVNKRVAPFIEDDMPELLAGLKEDALVATVDAACLKDADVVVTVIGTPVDWHRNPTIYNFKRDLNRVVEQMKDGALLVLRSTVYPGVTKIIHEQIVETGLNIHLAFCPERIAEGKALCELKTLPQIVSAFEPEALSRAKELFSLLAPSLIELEPLEAELAKLYTNCWRYLNFAVSNQFYMLAENYGLDFYKIYDAVTRDYPRMRSFARAGFAAGPCLLKDTLQLATFANNNFQLGHAAMQINEGLPNFIVDGLRKSGLSKRTVAILGMAFKGDSDDPRESLSYKLKNLLEVECRKVLCTDPFVQDKSLVPLQHAIDEADLIILGAPHSDYRELKIHPDKTVVDIWGFWNGAQGRTTKTAQEQFAVKPLSPVVR